MEMLKRDSKLFLIAYGLTPSSQIPAKTNVCKLSRRAVGGALLWLIAGTMAVIVITTAITFRFLEQAEYPDFKKIDGDLDRQAWIRISWWPRLRLGAHELMPWHLLAAAVASYYVVLPAAGWIIQNPGPSLMLTAAFTALLALFSVIYLAGLAGMAAGWVILLGLGYLLSWIIDPLERGLDSLIKSLNTSQQPKTQEAEMKRDDSIWQLAQARYRGFKSKVCWEIPIESALAEKTSKQE